MRQYIQNRTFYRDAWKLSLPIILQNLITFSLGLIDTLMVSQMGNTEMAAVTAANIPSFMLIAITFGVQSGLGILISQYWGKKDLTNISRAISVACILGITLSVVIAVILFFWPLDVMNLLSNSSEISILGAPYLQIVGLSYIFNMFSSIYVSAQRSVENPSFGMKLYGFSTVLNTFLNYLLIFGHLGLPALGIRGAAIATLCARIFECFICIFVAIRSRNLPLNYTVMLRPGREMFSKFIRYSSPVVLNETLWGLGSSVLTIILGYTDDSVAFLAAYSVAGNLGRLFLVVCFGLGAATAVIVGKAIGEGKTHDAVQVLSQSLLVFMVAVSLILAVISLLLLFALFRPYVFPLFKLYDESARIAFALSVASFASLPFHGYCTSSVTGVLRAGGDVTWAACLDLLPQWLCCIPLTALFALVLHCGYWPVAIALQSETFFKMPIVMIHIAKKRWIHDVTVSEVDH